MNKLALILAASTLLAGCGQRDANHDADWPKTVAPYIISRSDDGCAVYAFNPDGWRWRYFARCGAQTTTDNSYTVYERVGKAIVPRTVEDSVPMQGGK